jgi:hypothetical protein
LSSRRGPPRKAYLESLRKPSNADFSRLVDAAIAALIEGEKDVHISFSYLVRLPKDFPKRWKVEAGTGYSDIYKVRATTLLAWLNKHGYTTTTALQVRDQLRDFGRDTARLMRPLDMALDLSDNGVFDDMEEE